MNGIALPRLLVCQILSCQKTSLGSSYDESTKKGHVLDRPGQFPLLHRRNKSPKKPARELPSGWSPVFLHVASKPDCQVSKGLPVLEKAGSQCLVPNAELRRDVNEVGICRLASTCALTRAIGWLKGGSTFLQCKLEKINSLPYCYGLFSNFLKIPQCIELKIYPIATSLTPLSTLDDWKLTPLEETTDLFFFSVKALMLFWLTAQIFISNSQPHLSFLSEFLLL